MIKTYRDKVKYDFISNGGSYEKNSILKKTVIIHGCNPMDDAGDFNLLFFNDILSKQHY